MKSRATRIVIGGLSLAIAAVIWLPCVHLLYKRPAEHFHSTQGVSPTARSLAARQLELWTKPTLREAELKRMRASNAEWDFMGRSFLVWSLANMGLREPESKAVYLDTMDVILDETLRLEREHTMHHFLMPYSRWGDYVVQPERSLFVDGEIALMLASRQVLERKPAYEDLLRERVDLIREGFRRSTHGVLESYPDECWMFDHLNALAAIRIADHLNGTDHSDLIHNWLSLARQRLVHPESGLLVSSFNTRAQPLDGPEGSTIWMVAHCLQLLDPAFARDQYERARRELGQTTAGFSYAREWPVSWHGPADIDSGPIIPVLHISAGASGMAFIGAAAFEDQAFLSSLAATLDFAAFPSRQGETLKYCASNPVGDAALLYAATLGPVWDLVLTEVEP